MPRSVARPLLLAFAVHDHQPVGNFGEIFERAHRRAYGPFLNDISRFPEVHFSLHVSGALLEWLREEAPATVALIRELVGREQCEVLTGTYYEALVPLTPEPDVVSSIAAYSAALTETFGAKPAGMWLAERVFEPNVPALLARAGIRHLALDDWHFRAAGLGVADLYRPWLAADGGSTVSVCPISQRLRYMVPFAPVTDVIAHLRALYEDGAFMACLADDGEKFGEWPGTAKHCYADGWLDEFFAALVQNRPWLRCATLAEAVAEVPPRGPAYLPATSYYEMTRWALPADAQRRLSALGSDFAVDGVNGDLATGAPFRSFLHKYPEANYFQKRVAGVSRRLAEASGNLPPAETAAIKKALWRAQANDSYWHGVFGGFYLPHLRRAVRRELIHAEAALDRVAGYEPAVAADLDADGGGEIIAKNDDVVAVFKAAEGLAVAEFARREPPALVTDVPARRPEAYHALLAEPTGADGDVRTIHAPPASKEAGLEKFLAYDRRPKRMFLERVFDGEATLEEYGREAAREFADFAWSPVESAGDGAWRVNGTLLEPGALSMEINKKVTLIETGIAVSATYGYDAATAGRIGLEMTLSITSDSADNTVVKCGNVVMASGVFSVERVDTLDVDDRLGGWRLRFHIEPPAAIWRVPIYTVSCSEGGYEKIYQGSSFYFSWLAGIGQGSLGRRLAVEFI